MHLELLTNASLLDTHVWASPDVWTAALDYEAKKKSRRGGAGLIIGGICCLLVVALIIFGIYKLVNRNKQ
jgi:hypothetical protein